MLDRIIIFADYGLDDAAATVRIIKHYKRFENIIIVPIGGNVPPAIAFRNCLTLLNHYTIANSKITVVDAVDLPQNSKYLKDIHGNDGMGNVLEHIDVVPKVEIVKFDSWIEKLNGNETILSLGPMTLVKRVLERYEMNPIIIMGGLINEQPNYEGYEFNHCLDKEAFSFCTQFKHVAITLDTCRKDILNLRNVNIQENDIYSRILNEDKRLSITRGEDGCYVWDDIAACYLLYPERFIVEKKQDPYGNYIFNAEYVSDLQYFIDD